MKEEKIHTYLEGRASENDIRELMVWLDENPKNRKIFVEIKKTFIEASASIRNQDDQRKAFQIFLDKIINEEASEINLADTPSRRWRTWHYAAAIMVIFALSFAAYFIGLNQQQLSESQYHEIIVPYGGKSTVVLSDGTTVWLNAGSKLRYQKNTGESSRHVHLDGEAYFKVKKHQRPFIVHTSHLSVTVLGTVFNVKSYAEENEISAALVEGKIRIDTKAGKDTAVLLSENQIFTFYKDLAEAKVSDNDQMQDDDQHTNKLIPLTSKRAFRVNRNADIDKSVSWRSGKLVFDGETLETLANIIQRKYDVQFVFDSEEIKSFTYTGTLKDHTLEQVLTALKLTSPVDYSIQEKTVYLFVNESLKNKYDEIINQKD